MVHAVSCSMLNAQHTFCRAVGAIRLGDPRGPACLPARPPTKQTTKVSFLFGSTTQIGSSPAGMTTCSPSFPLAPQEEGSAKLLVGKMKEWLVPSPGPRSTRTRTVHTRQKRQVRNSLGGPPTRPTLPNV